MLDPTAMQSVLSLKAMLDARSSRPRLAEYLHLKALCPDGGAIAEQLLMLVAAADEYLDDLTLQMRAVDAMRVICPEVDGEAIRADVNEAYQNLRDEALRPRAEEQAA
ncbi:MAG: hypothetical protein RLZZ631_1289 [Cyanobacteriota bacterium]|jgi:hypothetical protein